MRRVVFVLALAICVASSSAAQKPPPSDERIVIDGSKNPELIPQWAAWESAFRAIDGGSKQLPSNVHHVATAEERAGISAEAAANGRRGAACADRIEREIRPLLGKETPETVAGRQQEIHVDCRWQTLHARDRLLAQLRPDVGAELIRFVEDMKTGTTLSMPAKELPLYRQPE